MVTHDSLPHGEVENPFVVHVHCNNLTFLTRLHKDYPKYQRSGRATRLYTHITLTSGNYHPERSLQM